MQYGLYNIRKHLSLPKWQHTNFTSLQAARLPSLPATAHKTSVLLQRSDCDWAGVSLNVTEILIFDCQVSDRGMGNYTSIYIKSLLTSIFISIFLIFWKNFSTKLSNIFFQSFYELIKSLAYCRLCYFVLFGKFSLGFALFNYVADKNLVFDR